MSAGNDLKREAKVPVIVKGPEFNDQYCDRSMVVGMPSPNSTERRVSILFSRHSIQPKAVENDSKAPFEVVIAGVAAISMNENTARKLAIDILKTVGDTVEEIAVKAVDSNES